jgi:hypothetical protein
MMKYLAVLADGEHYVEDSSAVVARNIALEMGPSYYGITIDSETNEPSLTAKIALSTAPRVPVMARERVDLMAGGTKFDAADLEILQE